MGMKKKVDFKKKVYIVEIDDGTVSATEVVYPMPGYGNSYSTDYVIDLNYSKAWARAYIYCFNNTWACRGHGMTEGWTSAQGYIRKGEIKEFVERVKGELERAEDGTPEVKEIYDVIKSKVEEICDSYDDDY
jgi:hypothetical protein